MESPQGDFVYLLPRLESPADAVSERSGIKRYLGNLAAFRFLDAPVGRWYNPRVRCVGTAGGNDGGSSSGRTAAFGAVNPGSNPGPPVKGRWGEGGKGRGSLSLFHPFQRFREWRMEGQTEWIPRQVKQVNMRTMKTMAAARI